MITGLDHYHTHMLVQVDTLLSIGFAVVVTPMPGTADSPITGREPLADTKYWTAIIDWIHSKPLWFDKECISVWGVSTGSYWAVKASRLEKNRIKRVVSQGTASHYTFTRKQVWFSTDSQIFADDHPDKTGGLKRPRRCHIP